jgi:4-hydroxythreonine-4-phosphate dehydrogenase
MRFIGDTTQHWISDNRKEKYEMNKPLIAIPIGDPAGIGPEITAKALASEEVFQTADCVIVGDRTIVENAIRIVNADLKVNVIHDLAEGDYRKGILNLIDLDNVDQEEFEFGKVSGMCGRAAYEYIAKSIELANEGKVDAVTTTAINKESLRAGGINYIGHTEIFGALTGTGDPLTMFETNGMRIFFLTRHVSLREMLDLVTKDRIKDYVKRCMKALEKLGVTEGTMAIAGLNPHSGEHGLFGWEEVNEITPAVEELRAEGYNVTGPIGADSVFHQAAMGKYNSVLSLYHDQGHIAAKTLDFERTIAITNGMPILRTSVDHGTAFDIAGKGVASAVSLIEAIRLAAKYAPHYVKLARKIV